MGNPHGGDYPPSNGRTFDAYYLNRKQAIFITAEAGTPTTIGTTVEIIEKFDAYERGATPFQKPLSREEFLAQAVLMADQTIKEQAEKIDALTPKPMASTGSLTPTGRSTSTELDLMWDMVPLTACVYFWPYGNLPKIREPSEHRRRLQPPARGRQFGKASCPPLLS